MTDLTGDEVLSLANRLLNPYKDNPSVQLEHSNVWLKCHPDTQCKGEFCTMHNRSNHSMREFPQHWRADRGILERICTHGVGHPDPDEITTDRTHGCDGCCATDIPTQTKSQVRRITKVKSDELREKELK